MITGLAGRLELIRPNSSRMRPVTGSPKKRYMHARLKVVSSMTVELSRMLTGGLTFHSMFGWRMRWHRLMKVCNIIFPQLILVQRMWSTEGGKYGKVGKQKDLSFLGLCKGVLAGPHEHRRGGSGLLDCQG